MPSSTPTASVTRRAQPLVVRIENVSCNGLYSSGTGFLLEPDLVVTVAHVVAGARSLSVRTRDGATGKSRVSSGKVIGIDPDREVALLKLTHRLSSGAHLDFAADRPDDQDPVISIGYPKGRPQTTTDGKVTGLDRRIEVGEDDNGDADADSVEIDGAIQFNAATNPGNSGGPLLNEDGDVVGLTEATASNSEGMHYAVAAEVAQPLVQEWADEPEQAPGCDEDESPGYVKVTSRHPDAPGIAIFLGRYIYGLQRGSEQIAEGSETTGFQLAHNQLTGQLKRDYPTVMELGEDFADTEFEDVTLVSAHMVREVLDTAEVTLVEVARDTADVPRCLRTAEISFRLDTGRWTVDRFNDYDPTGKQAAKAGVPACPS